MAVTVSDFVGSWSLGFVDSSHDKVQKDWILLIGTDSAWGDVRPLLTEKYEVCVGFALLAPNASGGYDTLELSTGENRLDGGPQALRLFFTGDQLRWKGYYERQPLYIYVSAAQTEQPGGGSVHLYGCTVYGDPDQVGVWGASTTPPPPPPAPEPGS